MLSAFYPMEPMTPHNSHTPSWVVTSLLVAVRGAALVVCTHNHPYF